MSFLTASVFSAHADEMTSAATMMRNTFRIGFMNLLPNSIFRALFVQLLYFSGAPCQLFRGPLSALHVVPPPCQNAFATKRRENAQRSKGVYFCSFLWLSTFRA